MGKYCKTIKNKRRCTEKKHLMNARDIISLQMNALQTDRNNSGIKKAWKYASKLNRYATGPYLIFERMIKNDIYKHLITSKKWSFVPKTITKKGDEHYSVIVKVISKYDGNAYNYRFGLSRQIDTLFWRTDSVFMVSNMKSYSDSVDRNIYDKKLKKCSTKPLTGYYRDGYCKTGKEDLGTHTVCAKMTNDFLQYSKSRGNDLITPQGSFPGLNDGDKWCLCSGRWGEAYAEGVAPLVDLDATHKKTLDMINKNHLLKNSL